MSDDSVIPIIPVEQLPKKEVEADDPFQINGVEFDGQSEEDLHSMALCFAEEFIREGWGEMELFYLFQNPFYAGPHLVWKQKGDDYVKAVISEAINMWRPTTLRERANGQVYAGGAQ